MEIRKRNESLFSNLSSIKEAVDLAKNSVRLFCLFLLYVQPYILFSIFLKYYDIENKLEYIGKWLFTEKSMIFSTYEIIILSGIMIFSHYAFKNKSPFHKKSYLLVIFLCVFEILCILNGWHQIQYIFLCIVLQMWFIVYFLYKLSHLFDNTQDKKYPDFNPLIFHSFFFFQNTEDLIEYKERQNVQYWIYKQYLNNPDVKYLKECNDYHKQGLLYPLNQKSEIYQFYLLFKEIDCLKEKQTKLNEKMESVQKIYEIHHQVKENQYTPNEKLNIDFKSILTLTDKEDLQSQIDLITPRIQMFEGKLNKIIKEIENKS